ncbi:MAG: flagellar hook assembly protein FlgD [Treponema sp.]|jgi:flagellar basal-body rod modification protein FlgD|nr:flagellar hook assembly protein FlgD [Treponema sp.]
MELKAVLSSQDMAEVNQIVQKHNSMVNQGKGSQNELGKDDFLKLLITQLSYQDPTAPMEDKEFIAQMAQFSTLEQMTSMATDFSRLASLLEGNGASAALGKGVELVDGEKVVQGVVKAVTRDVNPEILVNGMYYQWNQVTKVFEE